jgi:GNAT superfamily N-acetyltransferase
MSAIALRPLQGGDRLTVLEVFEGLSTRSRNLRFLGAKPRLNERDLELLVDVGGSDRDAVVAVDQETGRSIGIARFVRDPDSPEAEIAFEVVDEWHGRGVGRRLGDELARLARSQGILRLRASVDRSNAPALAVVRGLGTLLVTRSEGSVVELVVRLAD